MKVQIETWTQVNLENPYSDRTLVALSKGSKYYFKFTETGNCSKKYRIIFGRFGMRISKKYTERQLELFSGRKTLFIQDMGEL